MNRFIISAIKYVECNLVHLRKYSAKIQFWGTLLDYFHYYLAASHSEVKLTQLSSLTKTESEVLRTDLKFTITLRRSGRGVEENYWASIDSKHNADLLWEDVDRSTHILCLSRWSPAVCAVYHILCGVSSVFELMNHHSSSVIFVVVELCRDTDH